MLCARRAGMLVVTRGEACKCKCKMQIDAASGQRKPALCACRASKIEIPALYTRAG